MPQNSEVDCRERLRGFAAAVLAFVSWGLVPLYWKQLSTVPALEILSHRFVWTLAFSIGLLTVQRRWNEIAAAARSRRQLLNAAASGAMIAANWLIFIWAVNADRILETSLGYFMNPLVNVLFGTVFFRERLLPLQWCAVALAAIGVGYSVIGYGAVPWVALGLCSSFGIYGLLRKVSRVQSVPGLFLETAFVSPFVLAFLLWRGVHGTGAFRIDQPGTALLLAGGGVITALPLIWFAHAARVLPFSTVGIFQYLAPSLTFLIGFLVYGEPFTAASQVTFGCIWAALLLFNLARIK